MLHELLLALSGVPGDIFADDKAAQRYRIPDEYSFLHDSERSLLEAVAQLGYVYRQIREVLDQWARAGEPELPTQPAHVSKRALKRLQNAATHDFSNMDNALGPPGETVAPMIREKLVPSSYRTALAGAIEEQIMKPYRNLIIENERRLLPPQASDEDAVLTSIAMISHIFSKVARRRDHGSQESG